MLLPRPAGSGQGASTPQSEQKRGAPRGAFEPVLEAVVITILPMEGSLRRQWLSKSGQIGQTGQMGNRATSTLVCIRYEKNPNKFMQWISLIFSPAGRRLPPLGTRLQTLTRLGYAPFTVRTFQCKLDLFKSTEWKLRWDEDINGTNFELYIPKWRVPEPPPRVISVKICDATSISPSRLLKLSHEPEGQLSPSDMLVLEKIGLNAEQIQEVEIRFPIEGTLRKRNDHPIVAAVEFYETKTQTVRYRPLGDPKDWEVGEPYVPISELGNPYPKRLILLVGWVQTDPLPKLK